MRELSLMSCSRSSIDPMWQRVREWGWENCYRDPRIRDRRVSGSDLGNYWPFLFGRRAPSQGKRGVRRTGHSQRGCAGECCGRFRAMCEGRETHTHLSCCFLSIPVQEAHWHSYCEWREKRKQFILVQMMHMHSGTLQDYGDLSHPVLLLPPSTA